ncbi:hypothetical protein [Desulfovibrio sp. ZJ200]|uniref:tetratricopeptide repeat protein n=1 Tax=Desulfovibrio sp. ZJ200 TaxID=2709792 RepID=UPI0013ED69DF|nr:hypothetical protein [Desulfovibrio sp. ZJ200]
MTSSTIFDAVKRENEKLKIRLQALEAEKAREKAEAVELRLGREVDRSIWEHEKCQMLLQEIQIYFEKEKSNLQNQQKNEKDEREKYLQRVYRISNFILGTISAIAALLTIIIAISAWLGFGYFRDVKNEIYNIRNSIKECHNEVIADVKDIKRQKENLYAQPKNDGTLYRKTIDQAQETSKNPNTENIIKSQAILYTDKKQWDEAYVFWKAVLEKEPNSPDACFYVALSAQMLAEKIKSNNEKQKLFDVAEENYHRSVQVSPDSISAWCNWGNLCMKRGEAASSPEEKEHWFEQAAEKYRQATRRDPGHVTSWCNWGTLCMERGEAASSPEEKERWFEQAAEKYRQATRRDPGHVPSWGNWGNLCTERGEAASSPEEKEHWFEQAAEKYRQAMRINPEDVVTWFNLACLEGLRGNVALCVDCLEKWYALSPDASVAKLDGEKDFDPVRNSPEFKAFRENVQKGRGR